MCVLRNIQENVSTENKRATGNNLTHKQVESFINLHVKLWKLGSKIVICREKLKFANKKLEFEVREEFKKGKQIFTITDAYFLKVGDARGAGWVSLVRHS